jgi:chemotaxis protein MotA
MDILTILGLVVAVIGVIGGQILEGGHPGALVQGTAFMIVIVGSLGATLVAVPPADVKVSLQGLVKAFLPPRNDFAAVMEKMLELANLARREGLLALESFTSGNEGHPFLRKCLTLAIDGSSADLIRETAEIDMMIAEEEAAAGAKFWETWGGLCPTVGVLGAVLGLIHVMENLDNPAAIGPGIAVAFVATVYGVGFANVVCLPLAFKLKRYLQFDQLMRSMILDGVIGIQSGAAPGALRSRLAVYVHGHKKAGPKR